MPAQVHKKYLSGDLELEPRNFSLTRGGMPVQLGRKRFQVLLYLIENRDHLVTREELLARFWDGSEGYEENITKCISEIRKALKDQQKPHKFIETQSAVGYRFIGPLEEVRAGLEPSAFEIQHMRGVRVVVEEDDQSQRLVPGIGQALPYSTTTKLPPLIPSKNVRWLIPGISAGAVIALLAISFIAYRFRSHRTENPQPIRSLAVLPLKNLTGDPANDYFSEGMTDTLITNLSKVNGLKVISHESILSLKSKTVDPVEAARQLGVAAVLEGSVRKSDQSVRVAVRLISGDDGRVLWVADTNDRAIQDIFSLQDEIARDVVSRLRIELSREGEKRLVKHYTDNAEAYQLYLRGRYHLNKWAIPEVEKSIEYFQQAIKLDPEYALAYAGLADAYFELQVGPYSAVSVMPKAKGAASRAVELDGDLAEAHASLGLVLYSYEWRWSDAEREFKRALELNANSSIAHSHYSQYLVDMGRFDEGVAEIKKALELDPLSLSVNRDLGIDYYYARDYDRAIEVLQKGIELDSKFAARFYIWLERSYEAKGAYDQAIAADLKRAEIAKPDTVALLQKTYKTSGWKGYWQLRLAMALQEKRVQEERGNYNGGFVLVEIYARLGQKDEAFVWLEKMCEARDATWMTTIKNAPSLDTLRSDTRFTNLERRVGLVQ